MTITRQKTDTRTIEFAKPPFRRMKVKYRERDLAQTCLRGRVNIDGRWVEGDGYGMQRNGPERGGTLTAAAFAVVMIAIAMLVVLRITG